MRTYYRLGLVLALLGVGATLGYQIQRARAAGIPQTNTMYYSGTLETFGQPDNSTHLISVALFLQNTNPSLPPACATGTASITCVNGQFSIPLTSACVTVIHQNPIVWVQVTIDSSQMGMTPLAAVPYAVEADTASNAAPGSTLAAQIAAVGTDTPSGMMAPYAGSTAPPGWLLCNGASVSTTTYAALFAAIGYTYGGGGSSFNLPNTAGLFLRGAGSQTIGAVTYSGTLGVSQNDTTKPNGLTANPSLTAAGQAYSGSGTTGTENQNHQHIDGFGGVNGNSTYGVATVGALGNINEQNGETESYHAYTSIETAAHNHNFSWSGTASASSVSGTVSLTGDAETRPANLAVNYIIKT